MGDFIKIFHNLTICGYNNFPSFLKNFFVFPICFLLRKSFGNPVMLSHCMHSNGTWMFTAPIVSRDEAFICWRSTFWVMTRHRLFEDAWRHWVLGDIGFLKNLPHMISTQASMRTICKRLQWSIQLLCDFLISPSYASIWKRLVSEVLGGVPQNFGRVCCSMGPPKPCFIESVNKL